MARVPKSYRSIEEFEREEIRPSFRIGFSIDELEEGSGFDDMDLDEEQDLWDRPESEDDEDEEDNGDA